MFHEPQPLNRHIADAGFESVYGRRPTPNDDDDVRIEAHLAHVVDRLRQADVGHLTEPQLARRLHCLELLRSYRDAGDFPRNSYVSGRRPVFVDRDGRLCAVGYLIAQTAGWHVTEEIARTHRLAYIEEIERPEVARWAVEHGFELRELAMIQPTYRPIFDEAQVQLATIDFVFVLAVMPLLSVLSIMATRSVEKRTFWKGVGLLAGIWGGSMVLGNVFAFEQIWGHPWAEAIDWMVLIGSFFPAAGFLYVAWVELRAGSLPTRRMQARKLLTGAICVSTVVFMVSITPFSTEDCPGRSDGWTYDTNYGYWQMLVSPKAPGRVVESKRIDRGPRTGIGRAISCR